MSKGSRVGMCIFCGVRSLYGSPTNMVPMVTIWFPYKRACGFSSPCLLLPLTTNALMPWKGFTLSPVSPPLVASGTVSLCAWAPAPCNPVTPMLGGGVALAVLPTDSSDNKHGGVEACHLDCAWKRVIRNVEVSFCVVCFGISQRELFAREWLCPAFAIFAILLFSCF